VALNTLHGVIYQKKILLKQRSVAVKHFRAPCGTGVRSTVSSKIRRQQYGGIIVFRLAELKGKSFVEKGMQLQDIPS
jgi:hypothetical protein